MDKKNEHIDQLTPEIIKAYHSGELTAEQMHQAEVLMLENPLYAEGMEGIEAIDATDFTNDLSDLAERIDGSVTSRKISFWNKYTRVAATLLLLTSAIGLFYMLKDEDLPTKELSEVKKIEEKLSLDSASTNKEEEKEPDTPVNDSAAKVIKPEIETNLKPNTSAVQSNATALITLESQVFDETEFEVTDIQVAKLKEITLPMRSIDGSIDSALNQSLGINSRAQLKEKVSAFDNSAQKRKLEGAEFKSAFLPQNALETPQRLTVSGQIKGIEDGLPLPQATILIKGTVIGTQSSLDGQYQLTNVMPGNTLRFSFLGYLTQEVKIDSTQVLNIQLEPDATSLAELVVTGIGMTDDKEDDISSYAIAKPKGGYPSFNRYLRNNIKYPEAAKTQKVKGRVTLEFDVSETGELSNFKIVKGLGYGCDEEAIRLVKEGPQWNPKTEGITKTPVKSTVKIRVRFRP